MPYIKQRDREALSDGSLFPYDEGDLAYVLTEKTLRFLYGGAGKTALGFSDYATAMGIIECVKLELYRRMVAPYEDKKMKENGDVYE